MKGDSDMSSTLDAMRMMNEHQPFEDSGNFDIVTGHDNGDVWTNSNADPSTWEDRYNQLVLRQRFNPNIDGFIAPYASAHWGASSDIMQSLYAGMEMGPLRDKLDPNKIFTTNIAALKTLAADQAKTIKIFERKFMESLTDKGKFGVNEDDIEAMQALTSARSTLANIEKEQIAVRKSIAELKIKQQQTGGGPAAANTVPGRSASAFDVGRSIMDSIFDNIPDTDTSNIPANGNYPTADLDQASDVLNNLVGEGSVVSSTKFESDEPTTYVVVGDSDTDTEFVTLSSTGEILPDYPNPTTKIKSVDRQAKRAIDELMVSFPIKDRDEL
jgi:hypothetical protein